MTKAKFGFYMDYDETEKLARIYASKIRMPINITLEEGSDLDLKEGDPCEVLIWSDEYESLSVSSLEEWGDPDAALNPPRMLIPSGTFAADFTVNPDWKKTFRQNGTISFTGSVICAERIHSPKNDDPKWKLFIESFELSFWLYFFEDKHVEPGYIVDGEAWLSGKLKRTTPKQQEGF